ncbi:MAG TPA: ABC transporter permease [Mycobacteriales bacterium]|nr:ABC transporter permease [Mycobacteriales bacterium]
MTPGTFTPAPRAASAFRMVVAQAGMEFRLFVRNGEQLLLTVVIPTVVLALFVSVHIVGVPASRVGFLVPGVLALAVLSTSFTGLAIATGFERRYGVLKLLGSTPLPRGALLAGKTAAVLGVELLQTGGLVLVGLALGWHPHGSPVAVLELLLAGTFAFSGLGLLLAGTLRAEATLAAANLGYLVLLAVGGIIVPTTSLPSGVRAAADWLPVTALSHGLRTVLLNGRAAPGHDLLTLLGWAIVAGGACAGTFRWE